MKSLLCVIGMLMAVTLFTVDAQACNQVSQQVQFQTAVAYSQPVVLQEVIAQPVVYQQQVAFAQVMAQPVVYQQQFQQNVAFAQAYSTPQFQVVGCSRAGCSRAAIRGPRVQRSVQRVRTRG